MAAIELADRKKIQRGHEETKPGGEADRVEHHVCLWRERPDDDPGHEL